ncbi:MAG: hypothetical protein JO197_01995 [Acidobacteria bacterium]|nr:hypothetical protein [Acidobacteriota bacterium]MBV9478123.1 hypothetical protein [Acidobacteriota bacterium]
MNCIRHDGHDEHACNRLGDVALWGFGATVVLTTAILAAQSLGLTRIDMPFVLGTMVTLNRDRAKTAGDALHFIVG